MSGVAAGSGVGGGDSVRGVAMRGVAAGISIAVAHGQRPAAAHTHVSHAPPQPRGEVFFARDGGGNEIGISMLSAISEKSSGWLGLACHGDAGVKRDSRGGGEIWKAWLVAVAEARAVVPALLALG